MAIPDLNQFGVLPQGCFDCTLGEIEDVYAHNQHRSSLWAGFRQFLESIEDQPKPNAVLVDGGFTSDKEAPSDIDIVFDLSQCEADTQNHWIRKFMTEKEAFREAFRVDFWVYFEGAPNDLRTFFEYVRPEEAMLRGMQPEDRKGLLRVLL